MKRDPSIHITLENFRDKVTREHAQTELDINYLKQRIKALNRVRYSFKVYGSLPVDKNLSLT